MGHKNTKCESRAWGRRLGLRTNGGASHFVLDDGSFADLQIDNNVRGIGNMTVKYWKLEIMITSEQMANRKVSNDK